MKNAIVSILVLFPSILFYLSFLRHHNAATLAGDGSLSPFWSWCVDHPVLLTNLIFFFNVDILFWIIGLVRSNHSMISLYWSIIPVLLSHYYATHPLGMGSYNLLRSRVVTVLTWIWSIRILHNYLRKSSEQLGAREDWRFTDMGHQYGSSWWWASFFSIYVSQQVLLLGTCMPLYVVHSIDKPLNLWDFAAVTICIFGIVMAYVADTELHQFMAKNRSLKNEGKPVVPVLDKGLWGYSRHPNYLGEQIWWYGLALFAVGLGFGLKAFIGPILNSLCLAYVTMLVEDRMVKQEHRAEAYSLYKKRTPVWIPMIQSCLEPKIKPKEEKEN
ncbi:uncharacterized protein C594.04c [Impatiens glandulifera]|uniref:uncharacterized protein C594.04c n=1 Tax=Impatiens glandulifera TaxID=253017 RepID=UPI001FB14252|nr:uncharacterized protein C594.04c [Impatiens glandulifera]